MAAAITGGIAAASTDRIAASDIVISSRSIVSAQRLANEVGARAVTSNIELVTTCDVIILAVKPHAITAVLDEVRHLVDPARHVVVSLAAGTPLMTLNTHLPQHTPVIRVMPNVNASVGQSMTGVCPNGAVSDSMLDTVMSMMGCVGRCLGIDETQFPVFSAIAGCSPAWLMTAIDGLALAAVKHGMPKSQAVEVVAQAMLGSAAQVLATDSTHTSPRTLADRVCSPGGTTIAGLLAADHAGAFTGLVAAVDAAIARDRAIASQHTTSSQPAN